MHFRNNRISPLRLRNSKAPCPYHSRISTINSQVNQCGIKNGHKKSTSIDSIKSVKTKATQQQHLPKLVNSRYIKTQPSVDMEFYSYENSHAKSYDYYQDMKLDNQGWPTKQSYGRVHHARNDDVAWRSHQIVKQIYQDQLHNVKHQLQMIKRIKQRYKVLKNIENDKQKLKHLLKQMKRKKIFTQNENSETELDI